MYIFLPGSDTYTIEALNNEISTLSDYVKQNPNASIDDFAKQFEYKVDIPTVNASLERNIRSTYFKKMMHLVTRNMLLKKIEPIKEFIANKIKEKYDVVLLNQLEKSKNYFDSKLYYLGSLNDIKPVNYIDTDHRTGTKIIVNYIDLNFEKKPNVKGTDDLIFYKLKEEQPPQEPPEKEENFISEGGKKSKRKTTRRKKTNRKKKTIRRRKH